jgi:thiol-disulfide isomerase/thioredoxin
MKSPRVILLSALALILVYLVFTKIFSNKTGEVNIVIVPTEQLGINLGDTAPELNFENPDGEMIALSSMRGKIVLIDFWAGWCPPCRRENPNIVSAYKKYQDKEFINGSGFTVYGLSLDKTREQWLSAIADDGLIWPNHVSDLKGWNSVGAAQYQVRAIPANWLIDGNGVIIARNIKGEELHKTLHSLLK